MKISRSHIPDYLYHYTNLDALESILEKGEWRLYDAKQQDDTFELIYAGNQALEFFYSKLKSDEFKNMSNHKNILIPMITLYINQYFAKIKDISVALHVLMIQVEKGNLYKEIYNELITREMKYFISSFCKRHDNNYLWGKYTSDYQGVAIKFPKNITPKEIGMKTVKYYKKDALEYYTKLLHTNLENQDNDVKKIFGNEIHSIVNDVLSIKQEQFQKEEEYRLIDYSDSKSRIIKTFIDSRNGKSYIKMKINKQYLRLSIKNIYYHPDIRQENKDRLESLSEKYKLKLNQA